MMDRHLRRDGAREGGERFVPCTHGGRLGGADRTNCNINHFDLSFTCQQETLGGFEQEQLVHSRFLTSGRTVGPATLFSHSSVPRVLCACVAAGGRLFDVKSTLAGGMEGRGAVDPSTF